MSNTETQEQSASENFSESTSLYERFHIRTTVKGFGVEYSYLSLFLFVLAGFWLLAGLVAFFKLWPSSNGMYGTIPTLAYMPSNASFFVGLFMSGVFAYLGQALEYLRKLAMKAESTDK